MSLQSRISDLITAVGADISQHRVWMFGSKTGDLSKLNTTDKSSLAAAINEVKSSSTGAPPSATETTAGVIAIASQAETSAGSVDTKSVTPLKLQQKLTAFAQPLSNNLTALAGVVSGTFGRQLLTTSDAPSARTALGLAAVATSGSASDITTGILPSSVIPPLAINDTFTAASQSAMLALNAQRGDMAIRTDLNNHFFILITDDPTTLANWKQVVAASDVTSVFGRTGAVTGTSSDVGLGNVDNTSDINKPLSTATQNALATKLTAANNFSDVPNVATALNNLGVYSQTALGNPETDLVALYTTAKS